MKLLGTGLSGLVGSRVVELLSPSFTFQNYSLETGTDITNKEDIIAKITSNHEAPWVVHMAAFTDVQGAEKERGLGEASAAWKVNVMATQNIADACRASGKRLLYVDTDYAFDGAKKDGYTEDDVPSPRGWYAVTKSEGAKRVLALENGLVIRISNPYRARPIGKKDFAHKMLELLQSGQTISAPQDQLFVPTFIDDIARALERLVTTNASGIYHVVSAPPISPFDAAKAIAHTWGCDTNLVKPTTFAEYFTGRAPVPRYAVLANKKVTSLGIPMHDFVAGIEEVRRQESVIGK